MKKTHPLFKFENQKMLLWKNKYKKKKLGTQRVPEYQTLI